MKLTKILSQIDHQFIIKSSKKDIDINDINTDSRLVNKNSAFFALKGLTVDGNNFIQKAIDQGASLIVSDQDFTNKILENQTCVFIKTKNCFELLVEFLKIFYQPLPQNIYAITGTNGKTSTAEFIRQILQFIGKSSASIGTLGVVCDEKIKKNIPNSQLTTPDIVSNYKILSALKKNNIDDVAIEVSSVGLEQQRIAGIKINCGIFTNFSQDHLDYHKTMSEYLRCKMLLFSKVLNENDLAIINSDIEEFEKINKICQENRLKIYDYGQKAQKFKIVDVKQKNLGHEIKFSYLDRTFSFEIESGAKFEAENIFCALSTIIAKFQLNSQQIEELLPKLLKLHSANGRMQRVAILPSKAQIFIDFAHTPDSLEKILEQGRKMTKARLIVLFGCGGDRDVQKRPIMGKIATDLADLAIISDDNPRTEDPAQIRQEIIKSCKKDKFIEISSRKEAIKQAISMLKESDILILAGKGHEKYQIIGDQKIEFDEEKIVKEIIKKL